MVGGKFAGREWPPLPFIENETVIEAPVPAESLTKRCTDAAVRFIAEHKERPFFIYFPAAGPGSQKDCYPSEAFRGKSANGLYGDAIEELDWSAGEVLKAIKQNGLDDNTLVIWTNDNGAVARNPPQGSNAPYKGMGYSTSEGGMRMPCIARWPGKVPAHTVCEELCTMMDWVPTLAAITNAPQPAKKTDGHDIRSLLFDEPMAASPYDDVGFFYYHVKQLQAVRAGAWKLYLPLASKATMAAKKGGPQPLMLFDVQHDLSETHEASTEHPEIVQKLLGFAEHAKLTLGDGDHQGSEQRESGWVENPTPRIKR
jgi:arylsulfatase A-like enzyme